MLRGFYESRGAWRWTARCFAVSLDPLPADRATWVELDFTLPIEVTNEFRTVTLVGRVNGIEVGREAYWKPGRYRFARFVPLPALRQKPAEVEFELDRSITDPKTDRVLGLIAVSVGLKRYEETDPYREEQVQTAREAGERLIAKSRQKITPEKRRELLKLFHEVPVWENLWFHSVPVLKNPLDLWMMQQIIYEIQPEFIVETGTFRGGSALYFAHLLDGMGLTSSRVLTIDIYNYAQAASAQPLWKKYVEFYMASSVDPALVARIAQSVKGKKTLVVLDSAHHAEHVLAELRMYSPLVTPGSYLVVEDTNLDGVPVMPEIGEGPSAAVRKFLAEGGSKDFEQDASREAYVLTFNPGGWLRRK